MDKITARTIRHAIAEKMTEGGRVWGGMEDWIVGEALERVSLPAPTSLSGIDPLPAAQAYLVRMVGFPGDSTALDLLRQVVAALEAERARAATKARELEAELARLRSEVSGLRAAVAQAQAHAAAEHYARQRAETALRDIQGAGVPVLSTCDCAVCAAFLRIAALAKRGLGEDT